MLYNARCPTNYEIPGVLTEDVSLAAEEQSAWHTELLQERLGLGELRVGLYRVAVGASNVSSIEVPTNSREGDLETRMQLQSWQKSSSKQNNILLSTLQHDLCFHSASQESRKRNISTSPVEETPHKREISAGKAGYREAAPSMNSVPPGYLEANPSATRKASRREALITPDRSLPSTAFPMDGALEEAVRVDRVTRNGRHSHSGGGRQQSSDVDSDPQSAQGKQCASDVEGIL